MSFYNYNDKNESALNSLINYQGCSGGFTNKKSDKALQVVSVHVGGAAASRHLARLLAFTVLTDTIGGFSGGLTNDKADKALQVVSVHVGGTAASHHLARLPSLLAITVLIAHIHLLNRNHAVRAS